jgi:flagellar hook-length control protein FliK
MATALPHAPPTKAAFPNLKVPAAVVPTKSHQAEPGAVTALKSKFQTLLEQAAHAKPQAEPAAVKPKAAKPEAAEKPREAREVKKPELKHEKNEGADPAWLVAFQPPPKPEAAVKAGKATEADLLGAADKAKTAKPERKSASDAGQVVAWNPGTVETRTQPAGPGTPSRSERTEDRQKVFVVDRRSDKEKDKLKLPGAEAAGQQAVNAAVELQTQTKAADPKASATDVQVSFQVAGGKPKDSFDLKPQNTPISPRDAASFQQYLVERGYGQLVDQARIVLKDQNAGEIRMTLYPESLGKVKVALNLSDNSLAGQIYVENQTVKDVFQANMDGLMQAFRDGGWNDLSLQVSVGSGGGGNQAGNGQPQNAPQARDYDRQVTQTVQDGRTDRIGSWSDRQVNLTA